MTARTIAVDNAYLVERLRQSASTDGLTGIANRRNFDVTLDRYLARAVGTLEPMSLVLLDIDHFKRLNDEHGHQVGDDVLVVADRLRSAIAAAPE